jgi:integrase
MFSAMSATYLADCKARVQPITMQEKYRHLTEFAEFVGRDFPAEELDIGTAKAFIAHIQQGKGNKSANRRLGDLKACWNWHRHVLPVNPWNGVKKYPEEEYTKYVPPPENVAAVLSKASLWERRLLSFLLNTAARVGEAYQLTWDDVNLERNTVSLWTRKRKGGARQSRLVPLSASLRAMLVTMLAERAADNPYVFVNQRTNACYQRLQPSVRYMLKRLCKAAEVRTFGFHALRHYVSQRLMTGGNATLVDIQLLLGHQRATTTDIYLRSLSSSISHVAQFIEEDVLPKSNDSE